MRLLNPREVQYLVTRQALSRFPGACQVTTRERSRLGCGDGTTALPEARLGAEVLGVDIASNLVAAGNRRGEAEGLTNCRFQEGDASHLDGLASDTFDLVVSIFGAMFAPRPFDVAKEMVRVTRPGGRIVMGTGSLTTRR